MKLGIVHIGDLHISKANIDDIERSTDLFANKIISETVGIENIFFIFSGDLVQSGDKDEYEYAELIIEGIKDKLKDKKINLLFAPGNHDAILDEGNTSREDTINKILTNFDTSGNRIETCCSVLRNFYDFSKNFKFLNELHSDKLVYIGYYDVNGYKIIFQLINTSWLSLRHENPAAVWIPNNDIINETYIPDNSINITVFHHPFNWITPKSFNKKKYIDSIIDFSNIILSGHEHQEGANSVNSDIDNDYAAIVTTCQYNGLDDSGFNLIILDLAEKVQIFKSFKLSQGVFKTVLDKSTELKFHHRIKLTDNFKYFLNDNGFKLTHPIKGELSLYDVFVAPHVEDIAVESIDPNYTCFSKAIEEENNKKVIIVGAEQSGKTSLLKYSYSFYLRSTIPLYINGKHLENKNIVKHLKTSLNRQFQNLDWDAYTSLPIEQRIVLIDDFDKSPANHDAKKHILEHLIEFSGRIILTMSDVEVYRSKKEFRNLYWKDASILKIKPFGISKRDELYKKWIALSQDSVFEENHIVHALEDMHKKVSAVTLSRVIEPYPFYLLNILQISTSSIASNYKLTKYGDCYASFINFALARVISDKFDAYMNFLSLFAYRLYKIKSHSISKDNFDTFYKTYIEEYNPPANSDLLLNNLNRARILRTTEDKRILFNHPYVYYFCTARYISKNYEDPSVKEEIEKICSRVYLYQNANILIFLTHFLEDSSFWEGLLKNVTSLFEENQVELLNFESTEYLNGLFNEVPGLVIEEKESILKQREEIQKKRDEIEYRKNDAEDNEINEQDESDTDDEIDQDIFNKLLIQVKYLEIYGQILKNRAGSLPKKNIQKFTKESIDSSLRLLNFLMKTHEETLDITADFIKEKILEANSHKKIDEDKLEKMARKFLLALSFSTINAVLMKTSLSLGDNDLLDDNSKIVEENQHPAYEIIYMVMRMEFKHELPLTDLIEMKDKYKDNLFVYNMLRHLIYRFLYMHNVDYKMKPKIEEHFDIKITAQLQIQSKNKEIAKTQSP
jgi:hypothetical protein